jgi:hypothetical protein
MQSPFRVLLLIMSVAWAGCATPPRTSRPATAGPETIVTQVSSPGSWIPRKVKSKQDVIGDQTMETTGELLERANATGRAFRPRVSN